MKVHLRRSGEWCWVSCGGWARDAGVWEEGLGDEDWSEGGGGTSVAAAAVSEAFSSFSFGIPFFLPFDGFALTALAFAGD